MKTRKETWTETSAETIDPFGNRQSKFHRGSGKCGGLNWVLLVVSSVFG